MLCLVAAAAIVLAAVLGIFGGGNPTAAAVEIVPECVEYEALARRCFGSTTPISIPHTPKNVRPVSSAAPWRTQRSVAEICLARTNQLREVCR
jgi:hypothetical protein